MYPALLWHHGVKFLSFHLCLVIQLSLLVSHWLVLLAMMLFASHNNVLTDMFGYDFREIQWTDRSRKQKQEVRSPCYLWSESIIVFQLVSHVPPSVCREELLFALVLAMNSLTIWFHQPFPYWMTRLVRFQRWQQVWSCDPFQNIMTHTDWDLVMVARTGCPAPMLLVRSSRSHVCRGVSSQI